MPTLADFVKLSLDGHEIDKLTIGGKIVWVKAPSYTYKLVEYITLSGDGYVDLQYIPESYQTDGNLSLSVTLEYQTVYDGNDQTVYISGSTDGSNYAGCIAYRQYRGQPDYNTLRAFAGTKNTQFYYSKLGTEKTTIIIKHSSSFIILRALDPAGQEAYAENYVQGSIMLNKSLYIGNCNGLSARGMIGKISDVGLGTYSDSSVAGRLASLKPAVSADGAVGLYDVIRNIFCPAVGTVTAGPETGEYIT